MLQDWMTDRMTWCPILTASMPYDCMFMYGIMFVKLPALMLPDQRQGLFVQLTWLDLCHYTANSPRVVTFLSSLLSQFPFSRELGKSRTSSECSTPFPNIATKWTGPICQPYLSMSRRNKPPQFASIESQPLQCCWRMVSHTWPPAFIVQRRAWPNKSDYDTALSEQCTLCGSDSYSVRRPFYGTDSVWLRRHQLCNVGGLVEFDPQVVCWQLLSSYLESTTLWSTK